MYRVLIKNHNSNDLIITNINNKERAKELAKEFNAEVIENKLIKIKIKNRLKQNTQDFLHEYLKK